MGKSTKISQVILGIWTFFFYPIVLKSGQLSGNPAARQLHLGVARFEEGLHHQLQDGRKDADDPCRGSSLREDRV